MLCEAGGTTSPPAYIKEVTMQSLSYEESIVVCILLVAAALVLLAVCNWIGLGIMRIRDREKNRKRLCVVMRER